MSFDVVIHNKIAAQINSYIYILRFHRISNSWNLLCIVVPYFRLWSRTRPASKIPREQKPRLRKPFLYCAARAL